MEVVNISGIKIRRGGQENAGGSLKCLGETRPQVLAKSRLSVPPQKKKKKSGSKHLPECKKNHPRKGNKPDSEIGCRSQNYKD